MLILCNRLRNIIDKGVYLLKKRPVSTYGFNQFTFCKNPLNQIIKPLIIKNVKFVLVNIRRLYNMQSIAHKIAENRLRKAVSYATIKKLSYLITLNTPL